jgi:hypothetical protein
MSTHILKILIDMANNNINYLISILKQHCLGGVNYFGPRETQIQI